MPRAVWIEGRIGTSVFDCNADYCAKSGGILVPSARYEANVREVAIGCLEVYFEEALKNLSASRKLARRVAFA